MIRRAYYANSVASFLQDDSEKILGSLAAYHDFALEELQRNAWQAEIQVLKTALSSWEQGWLLLEYAIPRMGKRVDAVLLVDGLVVVIEFKVGGDQYTQAALDQVLDYALDLKNFHKASHALPLIPLLIATQAPVTENRLEPYDDLVYHPLKANASTLSDVLAMVQRDVGGGKFDPREWVESAYKPTPTIIEAAQALYQGHSVEEISRSEAGAVNLTTTTAAIRAIIRDSKQRGEKAICFVTGVPGAGKTLAGLNVANAQLHGQEEEYAVFLSGNGPLVSVLVEALARDNVTSSKLSATKVTKRVAQRKARTFVQNIHHFRDEALTTDNAPTEKVVVFDEAQRAWNLQQTAAFMKQKRGQSNFDKSEPEFLISVMDRHPDWAVIICLIGGGQEINTGEAGLGEWFAALGTKYPNWHVFVSNQLTDAEYTGGQALETLLSVRQITHIPELHLGVSMRSFRSELVSGFVKALLDLDVHQAQELYHQVQTSYPIKLTRNLARAREWLNTVARGTERTGLLASSGATRLRPVGIDVKSEIEVVHWFLNDKADVRSSFALEQAATEFDIQGLELDWTAVAWDADLRYVNGAWEYRNFSGASWKSVNDAPRKRYLKNAYRVLLTRARQGMVIFVPEGDGADGTRRPEFYDGTFEYLRRIGLEVI